MSGHRSDEYQNLHMIPAPLSAPPAPPPLPSGVRPNDSPQTPDLPCPKCGSQRTKMMWCDGRGWIYGFGRALLCVQKDDHFHRGCLRCEYRWITEDVVTG